MQANKKEREKAKRDRKEARKLAATPMPQLTEDVAPRPCSSAAEQHEVDEWIAQRKQCFPSAANVKRKLAAADAAAQAGEPPRATGCLCSFWSQGESRSLLLGSRARVAQSCQESLGQCCHCGNRRGLRHICICMQAPAMAQAGTTARFLAFCNGRRSWACCGRLERRTSCGHLRTRAGMAALPAAGGVEVVGAAAAGTAAGTLLLSIQKTVLGALRHSQRLPQAQKHQRRIVVQDRTISKPHSLHTAQLRPQRQMVMAVILLMPPW